MRIGIKRFSHLIAVLLLVPLAWGAAEDSVVLLQMEMPGEPGLVFVSEQATFLNVQVTVGGGSSFEKRAAPDVAAMHLQVWLLRTNGLVVQQRGKPNQIGLGNAGWDTDYMIYTFEKVPTNELAGLVVSINGHLYSKPFANKKVAADRNGGFPFFPPIATADPSIRHAVSVKIPTKLQIERTADMLAIGVDNQNNLETTNLMVGTNMVTGVESRWFVHPEGEARPAESRSLGLGGLDFNLGKSFLHTKEDGIPVSGKKYVVELDLTIFETDIPGQHHWMPRTGKYKVLWRGTLKQVVE